MFYNNSNQKFPLSATRTYLPAALLAKGSWRTQQHRHSGCVFFFLSSTQRLLRCYEIKVSWEIRALFPPWYSNGIVSGIYICISHMIVVPCSPCPCLWWDFCLSFTTSTAWPAQGKGLSVFFLVSLARCVAAVNTTIAVVARRAAAWMTGVLFVRVWLTFYSALCTSMK